MAPEANRRSPLPNVSAVNAVENLLLPVTSSTVVEFSTANIKDVESLYCFVFKKALFLCNFGKCKKTLILCHFIKLISSHHQSNELGINTLFLHTLLSL